MTVDTSLPPCDFNPCTRGPGVFKRIDPRRRAAEALQVCLYHRDNEDLPPLREGKAGPVAAMLLMLAGEHLTLRELGERLGVLPSEVARVARDLRLPVLHGRVHPAPITCPSNAAQPAPEHVSEPGAPPVPENHQVEGERTMENGELKAKLLELLTEGPHTQAALQEKTGAGAKTLPIALMHLARSKKIEKVSGVWALTNREVTAREHAEDAAKAISDDPKNNAVAEVIDDHTVEVRQAEPPKVTVTVEASNPEAAEYAQPTADALQAAMNKMLAPPALDIPTRLRNRIEELEKDFREVEKAIEAAHIKKGQLSVQIERHRMALGIVEALP